MEKKFIEFLKDNGVYEKYMLNLLKDFMEWSDAKIVISSYFVWEDTPEGFAFWSELNRKWYKLLSENNN